MVTIPLHVPVTPGDPGELSDGVSSVRSVRKRDDEAWRTVLFPGTVRDLWRQQRGMPELWDEEPWPSQYRYWSNDVEIARSKGADPFLDQTDPGLVEWKLLCAIAVRLASGIRAGERADGLAIPLVELSQADEQVAGHAARQVDYLVAAEPCRGPTLVLANSIQQCAPPVLVADVSPLGHAAAVAA